MRRGTIPTKAAPVIEPTLIERLNAILPIRYTLAALIVAVLLGPLGFFIADLLSYLDLSKATTVFLNASIDHYTLLQLVGNNVIYPGLIFYCALMIRYMRRRIIQVEGQLVQASPEWGEDIRKSFGRISSTVPALAITLLIFLLSYPLVVFQVSNNQGLAQLYFAITYPLFFFGAGTFIWMYVASLWGLYRIGSQPLKLKPYTEDTLLGLGGFGAISLTLTLAFLVAVFFAIFEFTVFASAMPLTLTIFFSGILILVGVCMFFLPLMNIHRRMMSERERLRNRNLNAIVGLVSANSQQEKVRSQVASLKQILVLEHEGEQIQAISTWPFDTPVIRSLTAIVLSVVASTSAHLIIVALNI